MGPGLREVGLRRTAGAARVRGGAWAGDSGDARPPRAPGSLSGSGLGARGRPGLACGRPRSAARPGPAGSAGKGLFLGVALISRHCPSLKPRLWGFLHRLQLSAGILECHGVSVLGVRGEPWRGRGEPLQHLLGDGRGGCVWGWDGETKRD